MIIYLCIYSSNAAVDELITLPSDLNASQLFLGTTAATFYTLFIGFIIIYTVVLIYYIRMYNYGKRQSDHIYPQDL